MTDDPLPGRRTGAVAGECARRSAVSDVEIVNYQVVIVKESVPQRSLEATLTNAVTSFGVPPEFVHGARRR